MFNRRPNASVSAALMHVLMLSLNTRIPHGCATWQMILYSNIFYFCLVLTCLLQLLCLAGHTLWFIHLWRIFLTHHNNRSVFFWWKQLWVVIILGYDHQARIVWFPQRWGPPLPLADTNLHLLHCLVNQMLLSHKRSQTLIPCPPNSLLFSSFWPSVNQRGRDVTA